MENFFFENVFINFFSSLIFIITIFLYSYIFSNILVERKLLSKNILNTGLVFFFNFGLLSAIINYAFLLNIISFFSIRILILFVILLYPIIFLIFKQNIKINLNLFNLYLVIKKNIFLFLLLFLLFIVALFPISDADSLVTHLNIPLKILMYGNFFSDLGFVEFKSFAGTEILLTLSPALKSDNFGSILNTFSLLMISLFFLYKKEKNILIFILAAPLIIFIVSTQKLQLFFALIFLLIFYLFEKEKNKNNLFLFFISFLLVFYFSAKINYVVFALPLFIYFFFSIKNKKKKINFLFFCLFSFFLILFPLLLKKYLLFGDPFSPFFEFLKNNPDDLTLGYAVSLRSSEGWLNNSNYISTFFKPFFPINIDQLSKSLGAGFILIFFIPFFKKITAPVIIALTGIILTLITGQVLPRYFLEGYFLLSLCLSLLKVNLFKNFFLKILNIQIFINLIFVFIFLLISLKIIYPFKSKENYFLKNAFSYERAQIVKNLNLNGNILDFEQIRTTLFYPKNYISIAREVSFYSSLKDKNDFIEKFIKKQNIKYIIIKDYKFIPKCIKTKLLKKIDYQSQKRRNFIVSYALVSKKDRVTTEVVDVLEIKKNQCY